MTNPLPLPVRDEIASAHLFVGYGLDAEQIFATWANHLGVSALDEVRFEEGERITLAEVRNFQRELLLQPLASRYRLGYIPQAERLTLEAANALLKLLEDPPSHALILLTVTHEDYLLPTLVSRCQRWRLPTTDNRQQPASPAGRPTTDTNWEIDKLQAMTYRERFQLAEEWSKRETFWADFDALLLRARMIFLKRQLSPTILERLMTLRSLAETNVSRRLLAENALLAFGRGNQ